MAVQRRRFKAVSLATIQTVVDQLVAEWKPEKVILFGYFPYESPQKRSEVDLLVVMEFEGEWREQAAVIRSRLKAFFPMVLVPMRPGEYARLIEEGDPFVSRIQEAGVVLHEAPQHNT